MQGLLQAVLYASDKHRDQKRKINGEPYVHHCMRVSQTVDSFSNGNTKLIIVALLHDAIEDTTATYHDLKKEFGQEVADMVLSLTNNKTELAMLGKTEYLKRKVNKLTDDELLIKLADRLDNIRDLSDNEWSREYARQTGDIFFGEHMRQDLNPAHIELLSMIAESIAQYI